MYHHALENSLKLLLLSEKVNRKILPGVTEGIKHHLKMSVSFPCFTDCETEKECWLVISADTFSRLSVPFVEESQLMMLTSQQ